MDHRESIGKPSICKNVISYIIQKKQQVEKPTVQYIMDFESIAVEIGVSKN